MKDLAIKLRQIKAELHDLAVRDAPVIIGKVATDHFKESFQNEGFTDQTLNPWKEVKRRQNPKITGAKASRKILTGDTGDLGESIKYRTIPGAAVIYSDKAYAEAHNEGTTTAGRGNKTTIPKRQFIGESATLDNKIEQEIERKLGLIFD